MFRSWKNVKMLKQFGVLMKQYIRSSSDTSTTVKSNFCKSNAFKQKSSLYRQLYSKILSCGPISIADYMKEVLTNPIDGYYMKKDVFGQKGDFVTSPEISQLFGEMIAVWILHEWSKISNQAFQLVELGPGRGTLSSDILRVFNRLGSTDKVSLHLVEISPILSAIQAKNLCLSSEEVSPLINSEEKNIISHYRQGITKEGVKIFWYYSVKDIPRGFSIFIAHEFFDALPIHKFQKTSKGWSEVLVDIEPNVSDQEKFRYVLTKTDTLASRVYIQENETRNHVEMSPQTVVIIDTISTFLVKNGGFGLIIDYGHNDPGTADLTADVDFSLIRRIATKDNRLITFGPVDQGDFLKQLGISVRLESLLRNATSEQKEQIQSGYHKIVDESEMGSLFKVFSMFPAVLKDHLRKWPVSGFGNA